MAVERGSNGSSIVDILDRVLDKGIVIDAWVRVSLAGIDLLTVEARVVVASMETFLRYADVLSQLAPATSAMRVVASERTQVHLSAPVTRRRRASRREPGADLTDSGCLPGNGVAPRRGQR